MQPSQWVYDISMLAFVGTSLAFIWIMIFALYKHLKH